MVQSMSLAAMTVFLSLCLTGLATWYSRRRGLLDIPGQRHSHTDPTPRGGGVGMVLAIFIMMAAWAVAGQEVEIPHFFTNCLLPGAMVLSLIGWWDDHRPLSARLRFSVQLLVSFYLIWCAGNVLSTVGAAWTMIAILSLIWMTNLYNFMDGSNGMAGAQGVFAGLVLAWLFSHAGDPGASSVCLVVAAACLGFLPWNLGRARVFMGDVGSGTLGFIIGVLLLYGGVTGAFSLPVAALVMLVFLIDATLTLLLRVMRGERWYTAHKQHLYQQLIQRGWSHGSVLLLYQVINLTLVLPAIAVAVNFPAVAWTVAVVTCMIAIPGWILVTKRIGVFA
jgi:UDP-N-acetylmuramyl pentapeptide phosphotransferase/UDP-N-acetylglucosamine-1-phosphate transferase